MKRKAHDGLVGIVLPVVIWLAAVYLRTIYPHDIHPWQFEWIFWVVSISVCGGGIGWGLCAYWNNRRS